VQVIHHRGMQIQIQTPQQKPSSSIFVLSPATTRPLPAARRLLFTGSPAQPRQPQPRPPQPRPPQPPPPQSHTQLMDNTQGEGCSYWVDGREPVDRVVYDSDGD
jgi:hypothetical protein